MSDAGMVLAARFRRRRDVSGRSISALKSQFVQPKPKGDWTCQDQSLFRASFSYLPALDGLRAISVMLVVVSHAGLGYLIPGGLGVIVFFAISGFLLTRQMIAEVESTRDLSIPSFYLRRVFRLAPALLVYLVVFNTALHALGVGISTADVAASVAYVANYYDIFVGFADHSPGPILWSLAVEEHYYLVFPFVARAFRADLSRLLPWVAAMVFFVLVWRAVLYHACSMMPGAVAVCDTPDSFRIFHGTDTMIDCILWGAMAAIALHFHTAPTVALLINRTTAVIAVATLIGCLLVRNDWFREVPRYALEAIASSVIILNVLFGPFDAIRDMLSNRLIVFVGRLSYSLYLFHYGVLMIVEVLWNIHGDLFGIIPVVVYFLGSFASAWIAFVLLERPMIALRIRFGTRAR